MRIHANPTMARKETDIILHLTDLTKPLSPRDVIVVSATGRRRQVTVTKVTPTYVWVEYTSPSTHRHHNTPFRRYPPGVNPPKEQP